MQRPYLGRLGETAFTSLCLTAGLTINSSSFMDMTGWDCYVEFPFNQHDYLPQDLLPTPIECKIQVKSTDGRERKNDITLSNLNRFITTKLPTFYCFIEFDGKDTPQAIYLVHIGKEIIEKTLKKIRKLEAKGCGDKLNKKKLRIKYEDADRLKSIDGMELKVAIEKYIPDGMKEYIEGKNHILNTVGFEDGKYQAKITMIGNDPMGDILDLTLGLRKEIDISRFTSYHKRFGILSGVPNIDCFGEGTISIDSSPLEVTLKFKENKFSSGIRFAAQLYIPPFSQELLREHGKFRVASRFFELIFELDKVKKFSILPYLDEESPLRELVNFLNLLSIFEKSSKTITLEIESQILGLSPLFSFKSTNILSSLFNMNEVDHQKSTWNIISKRVEAIGEVCRKMNVLEETFVKVNDLLSIYQDEDFQLLSQALCGHADSIVIDFSDGIEGYQENARAVGIRFVKFSIGNYTIGCCLGISGYLTLIDGQQKMICQEFIVGRKFIKTDDICQEEIGMSCDELVEELQNEDSLVTIVSF